MKPIHREAVLRLLNLLTFLLAIAANWAAVTLPLNGKTTRELSDQYPNLFTPAGLTFSIWGVIYLTLGAFVLFQLKGLFRNDPDSLVTRLVSRIGPWLIVSNLLNASWIVAWHYEQVALSVGIMLGLLCTQLILLDRIQIIASLRARRWQYLLTKVPFGLYAGWISMATIANITAWLISVNWNQWGLGGHTWAMLLIGIGTLLTLGVLFTVHSISYGLVVMWALAGIVIRRYEEPEPVMSVIYTAEICFVVLLISVIVATFTGVTIPVRKRPFLHWTQPRVQP